MRVHVQLDAPPAGGYASDAFNSYVGRMVPVTGCGLDPHGSLAQLIAAQVTDEGHAVLTLDAQESVARALMEGVDGTFYLLSWHARPGMIQATPLAAEPVHRLTDARTEGLGGR